MKAKSKNILLSVLVGLCGIISLWLVISHIANFSFPNYFYKQNPGITLYVGINVVSPWADFSFFTYITMIIFGFWCVLFAISELFKIKKLNNFLRSKNLISFVFCNYIITILLYTFFELCSGNPSFGWFGNYPNSWHSLGTNIVSHYILFAAATVIFVKTKPTESKNLPYFLSISSFLLIYYVIVKLTGEFAYNIKWFPYIIFDAKTFGKAIGTTNYPLSVFLLVLTCVIIVALYFVLYALLVRWKSKKLNECQLNNVI